VNESFLGIREKLLEEARRSVELLSDIAGLEKYVAESYNARSFVELLQNADDAGASRFLVARVGEMLFVANDGRVFTPSDFESLCRSAASSKTRGESIGFRGIGFKSVVGLADIVYLVSGSLQAVFSRERTQEEIPSAKHVPLIRIPHPFSPQEQAEIMETILHFQDEGYTSIFGFKNLVASNIESEFTSFDPTSLMFLRRVRHMELRATVEELISIRREKVGEGWTKLKLSTNERSTGWLVYATGEVALAFSYGSKGVEPLNAVDAVVHAFLPTNEATGLGVKVNGDFSTDPSRTRIVFDDHTFTCLGQVATLTVELLKKSLKADNDSRAMQAIEALAPLEDPRITKFKRQSFATEFVGAIKSKAGDAFTHLRLRPIWLNAADFKQLANGANLPIIAHDKDELPNVRVLLRFLGAEEAKFNELAPHLTAIAVSPIGAAELISQVVRLSAIGQLQAEAAALQEWPLWVTSKDELVSLASASKGQLQQSFLDAITEQLGSTRELEKFLDKIVGREQRQTLLGSIETGASAETTRDPEEPLQHPDTFHNTTDVSAAKSPQLSLTRWRGAEQQVVELFEQQGWSVADVSRQNIGYDIEAVSPSGETAYIEVKKLKYLGEAFILTSNEEAVARLKGQQYWLALVCEDGDRLRIGFVKNPSEALKLERQCRQWVWECVRYDQGLEIQTFKLR
jgi:hypothetical protein